MYFVLDPLTRKALGGGGGGGSWKADSLTKLKAVLNGGIHAHKWWLRDIKKKNFESRVQKYLCLQYSK